MTRTAWQRFTIAAAAASLVAAGAACDADTSSSAKTTDSPTAASPAAATSATPTATTKASHAKKAKQHKTASPTAKQSPKQSPTRKHRRHTASPSATGSKSATRSPSSTHTTKPKQAGPARTAVDKLTVEPDGPQASYDRDKFGTAWKDTNDSGCDQRNDVLNRDLTGTKFDGCNVLRGTLDGPYTGKTIHFKRGTDTSIKVQIDHVVALSDAWKSGANHWTDAKRLRLATDTLNLLAVDGPANQQKSDSDASDWLPSHKSFRCNYVARQAAVKQKYHLSVTKTEQKAMRHVLSTCPRQKLPNRRPIPDHPSTSSSPHSHQSSKSSTSHSHHSGKSSTSHSTTSSSTSGSSTRSGGGGKHKDVHPGAYCSQDDKGAKGTTKTGTTMRCTKSSSDDRLRWRSK